MERIRKKNLKLIRTLIIASIAMFGFGFLLVPLYDVFCEITGLNGKLNNTASLVPVETPDRSRDIRIQLIAVNNEGMPWRFRPASDLLTVNPGQINTTHYSVFNPTSNWMIAQAVPSVAPSEAAQYFHKVSCFCFEQQPLESRERRDMPVVFVIDKRLPEYIKTVTLSYTLFDITPKDGSRFSDVDKRRQVAL